MALPLGSSGASGWLEALAFVFCIAVLSIVYAIALESGAHVTAFILLSTVVSGGALVLIVGPGSDGLAIMKAPSSWLLGLLHIAMEGAYCIAMISLSPTETSLLVRLSVPVAMATSAVVLNRKPNALQMIGAAIVTAAVLIVILPLDFPRQLIGLLACLSCALTVTFRALASEFHPWNRAARTITAKLQVTGLLVLVTALASLVAVGVLMGLIAFGVLAQTPLVPKPADFLHTPTLLLALLVGGAVFTMMNYLQFSAVVKIGTENLIVVSALMPMATLALQYLAGTIGLIRHHAIEPHLWPALILVVIGIAVVIRGRSRA